jgi:hypothetical protein
MELDGHGVLNSGNNAAQRSRDQQKCHHNSQDKCANSLVHDISSIIDFSWSGHTCPQSYTIKPQTFSQVNGYLPKIYKFGKSNKNHRKFYGTLPMIHNVEKCDFRT